MPTNATPPAPSNPPRTPDATGRPLTFEIAREYLRVKEACELAGGISSRTLRRWLVVGKVHAVKPTGGMVLISRDSLRAFLENAPAATYYGRHYTGLVKS
jgi:excisionase family DNA binding protein